MNTCYLTLWFVLALVLPLSSSVAYPTKHIPAFYVFGDSLVDCGNNNHLPSGGPSFLLYGIDSCTANLPGEQQMEKLWLISAATRALLFSFLLK